MIRYIKQQSRLSGRKRKPQERRSVYLYKAFDENDHPITVHQWLRTMNGPTAAENAMAITEIMETVEFDQVYFECPAMSHATSKENQFEFVLIDAPEIVKFVNSRAGQRSMDSFRDIFAGNTRGMALSFMNISKESWLVAPRKDPEREQRTYTHLKPFAEGANENEIVALWGELCRKLNELMEEDKQRSYYLSTNGLSVAWLHIRIDETPKYYNYQKYRENE